MNMSETAALIRFIKAACPAQAIDEYTAEAWALAMEDIDASDAKTAVVRLVREKPYIGCSDIVAGVKQIRERRLQVFGDIGRAPDELLSDMANPRAWIDWEEERKEAIRSGRLTRENDPYKELT